MSNVKNLYRRRRRSMHGHLDVRGLCLEFESEAPAAEDMLDRHRVVCSSKHFSFYSASAGGPSPLHVGS